MENKLYFFVKMPRAGGSTYAKEWINNRTSTDFPRVVICQDEIRKALTGFRWNGICEGLIPGLEELQIRQYLNMGWDCLIDETHSSLKNIKRMFSISKNSVPILIPTDKEVCKERAKLTNQEDLYGVIDRVFNNLRYIWDAYYDNVINPNISWEDFQLDRDFPETPPMDINNREVWDKIFDAIRDEVTEYSTKVIE